MALAKCAHAGCNCLPAPKSEYCGPHCAAVHAHEPKEETGCMCAHPGCQPSSQYKALHAAQDKLDAWQSGTEPRH